ncbi:hypothetical protein RhiirA5_506958 [Rhizophagus irregularis]|uniref:Uncharacterized protein n=1 Tax=Rhizophagus irregularis TaxID=588596 RepID=A0A2N0NPC8_9GLOM|nr:hypothetical protein RhiirA5_506958 [Rhizophagus irregularis]PKC58251.1 hypothetical protein RhiirA1_541187 [Rhizophagus irregularis]GET64822.1 hypothetical protein GLOIN_2v1786202 [Rhizophagus irregularis DAOM 181602=DAOM 197198]
MKKEKKNSTGNRLLNLSDTLFKRNTDKIENDICKRCGKNEKETWEHIWLCEDNVFTIDEIVQESIYRFEKRLEDDNKNDEIKILRNYNFNLRTPFDNIERKKSNMGDT